MMKKMVKSKYKLVFCDLVRPMVVFTINVIKTGIISTYELRYPNNVKIRQPNAQTTLTPVNWACVCSAKLNGESLDRLNCTKNDDAMIIVGKQYKTTAKYV